MKKKALTLFTTALFAVSCITTGIVTSQNNISNFKVNVNADSEPYTLSINSPLYDGVEQSGEDFTYVKTGNKNDVKVKYNKLSPFVSGGEDKTYKTGFNTMKDGSYIEIVQNGSIEGLSGISKVTLKSSTGDNGGLKLWYGWENETYINYIEQTLSTTHVGGYYEFDLLDGPSYLKLETSGSEFFYTGINEIEITYSCSKTPNPYAIVGDFTLYNAGDHYEVTSYNGSNTVINDIPSEYNDIPVTAIADDFKISVGVGNITGVTLPSSITRIGNNAFRRARNLDTINLENVTYIGDGAFYQSSDENPKLDNINIDNATYIGERAFQNCYLYNDVFNFTSTSVTIHSNAFAGTQVRMVQFSSDRNASLTIGSSAFSGCTNLYSITLPTNISRLRISTFKNCIDLLTITYYGTHEQWEGITKDTDWYSDIRTSVVRCVDSGDQDFPL